MGSSIKYETDLTFIEFDILSETGKMKINELDLYISKLYQKETMEIIQSSYIKIKNNPSIYIDTTNFVITNPYTDGMISLITALNESNNEFKHTNFKEAIKKLEHIKYYYVESIYLYSKFLFEENEDSSIFDKYFDLGIKVSKQYNFWFLNFKLEKIKNDSLVYNEDVIYDKFVNIERNTFDLFIEQYISERKKAMDKNS